jgi:hypothetical protein
MALRGLSEALRMLYKLFRKAQCDLNRPFFT